MTHYNEDELLEYALETSSDDSRRAEIEVHLTICSDCRVKLEEIRKDIDIISSVRPLQSEMRIPVKQARPGITSQLLKAAALIIFGIALGAGASKWLDREPATVSPAYITLTPLPDSLSGFVAADVTGITVNYYRQILSERD